MFSKDDRRTDSEPVTGGRASSVWTTEIELGPDLARNAARRVGLTRGRGATRLSLEAIDRRRLEIWLLTAGLIVLVSLTMVLVSDYVEIALPKWLPKHYVLGSVLLLTVLYGMYIVEKESQLRKLTRYLVEEQFHKDIVNRRLKVVDSLLESSKAVNQGLDRGRALGVIARQAGQFFENDDVCIYLDEGGIRAAAGAVDMGAEELARAVVTRRQSRFVRPAAGEATARFGVPVGIRDRVFGAVCLSTSRQPLDSFETLLGMSLFAEQAAAVIARARKAGPVPVAAEPARLAGLPENATGLLGRGEFLALLDERIRESGSTATAPCVMFFNIDDLARINARHGYQTGDMVIADYAATLRASLPGDAIAGHFGGDEFMAAVFDIGGRSAAEEAARALHGRISRQLQVESRKFWFGSSVGVAVPDTDTGDARELVARAQIAMRRAKAEGGGTVAVFVPGLRDEITRDTGVQEDLHRALEYDEIVIHLQPIFDLATMAPVAAEALARREHPARGVLPPSTFMPVASRAGDLKLFDRRIVESACATVGPLERAGLAIPVHINLVPAHLTSQTLLADLGDILAAAGGEPRSFVLELSDIERIVADARGRENVKRLRAMGFAIALDNFGGGAAAFAALQSVRTDMIKIARSLIAELGAGESPARHVVETIVTFARQNELPVIAVGVENERQAALLRDLGCARGQGNHLGTPLPVGAFTEHYGGAPGMARHEVERKRLHQV